MLGRWTVSFNCDWIKGHDVYEYYSFYYGPCPIDVAIIAFFNTERAQKYSILHPPWSKRQDHNGLLVVSHLHINTQVQFKTTLVESKPLLKLVIKIISRCCPHLRRDGREWMKKLPKAKSSLKSSPVVSLEQRPCRHVRPLSTALENYAERWAPLSAASMVQEVWKYNPIK